MSETPEQPARRQLVIIGASAGGVEALISLVSTLPRDFPAPLVLAQHLDPNRPSQLGPILERHTTLPVVTVQEKAALEDGIIYVLTTIQKICFHASAQHHANERCLWYALLPG